MHEIYKIAHLVERINTSPFKLTLTFCYRINHNVHVSTCTDQKSPNGLQLASRDTIVIPFLSDR